MAEEYDAFYNSLILLKSSRSYSKVMLYLDNSTTASFWTDKLFINKPNDLFLMAGALFDQEQYSDCINFIDKNQAYNYSAMCKQMFARCLHEQGEFSDTLEVLDTDEYADDPEFYTELNALVQDDHEKYEQQEESIVVLANLLLLRAHIYKQQDCLDDATEAYWKALCTDICCFEAFSCLMKIPEMKSVKLFEMLESIPVNRERDRVIIDIYMTLLHPLVHAMTERNAVLTDDYPENVQDMACAVCPVRKISTNLTNDVSIKITEAEMHTILCNYEESKNICHQIFRKQAYQSKALIIYATCLAQTNKRHDLFKLGHNQIGMRPRNAASWYISGCYYLLSENYHTGRTHFAKSIDLDSSHPEAWIGFGHCYSGHRASEQAFAAYLEARRLLPTNHMPILYLGSECLRANHLGSYMYYLEIAYDLAPNDADVCNELGVGLYFEKKYKMAEKLFLKAIFLCENFLLQTPCERWEPVYNNLGLVYFKLQDYTKALNYFEKALTIDRNNANTWINMALVHLMLGNHSDAIDLLNTSLSLKPVNEVALMLLDDLFTECDQEEDLLPSDFMDYSITDEERDTNLKNDTDLSKCRFNDARNYRNLTQNENKFPTVGLVGYRNKDKFHRDIYSSHDNQYYSDDDDDNDGDDNGNPSVYADGVAKHVTINSMNYIDDNVDDDDPGTISDAEDNYSNNSACSSDEDYSAFDKEAYSNILKLSRPLVSYASSGHHFFVTQDFDNLKNHFYYYCKNELLKLALMVPDMIPRKEDKSKYASIKTAINWQPCKGQQVVLLQDAENATGDDTSVKSVASEMKRPAASPINNKRRNEDEVPINVRRGISLVSKSTPKQQGAATDFSSQTVSNKTPSRTHRKDDQFNQQRPVTRSVAHAAIIETKTSNDGNNKKASPVKKLTKPRKQNAPKKLTRTHEETTSHNEQRTSSPVSRRPVTRSVSAVSRSERSSITRRYNTRRQSRQVPDKPNNEPTTSRGRRKR